MMGLRKINSKKLCFTLMVFAFSIAITSRCEAHSTQNKGIDRSLTRDTTPRLYRDTIPAPGGDTSGLKDSALRSKTDTFPLKVAKDTLDAPVSYEAQDSAVILVPEQKVLLYGKTKTTYKDVTLTAPRVEMDQVREQFFARARLTLDQNCRVCVGNIQRELDRPLKQGSLTDDLAVPFVQLGLEPHHLCR